MIETDGLSQKQLSQIERITRIINNEKKSPSVKKKSSSTTQQFYPNFKMNKFI
jgi:hypothetical protein